MTVDFEVAVKQRGRIARSQVACSFTELRKGRGDRLKERVIVSISTSRRIVVGVNIILIKSKVREMRNSLDLSFWKLKETENKN